MSLKYMIDGEIEQTIAMKINEGLAFPDKIRIVRRSFIPSIKAQGKGVEGRHR